MKNLLCYIDAKLVAPREFKKFVEPIQDSYQELKQQSASKNYFRNDLGLKGAISRARLLGLHKSKGLRILDIGTGPGMFPAICNWYGHEAIGTDVPTRHESVVWFEGSTKLFDVEVVPLTIKSPEEGIQEVGGKWDLITGFLSNFDNGWNDSGRWETAEWETFIRNLMANSLQPGGRLAFLPCAANAAPLVEVASQFDNVRFVSKWGVWIFEK